MFEQLEIFVDGASHGNPGPGAIGIVIFHNKEKIKEIAKAIGDTTNNVAEYQALLGALAEAKQLGARRVKLFTDSQLMFSQLTGKYQVKHPQLKSLFDQAQGLAKQFEHIEICHIPREKNHEADRLAASALKNKQVKMVASTLFNVGEESPSSEG